MNHYIKKFLPLAALAIAMASCTEITDYPDGSIPYDEIFQNEKKTAGWLNYCYMPMTSAQFGSGYGANKSFLDAATDNAHDVDDAEGGAMSLWNNAAATAFNNPLTSLDKWESYYQGIASCNILLANLDNAYILEEGDRERYRGEAYGLRAYYYLQLAKIYGGVPIILSQTDDSEIDYSKVKPATFAEVIRQIFADCDKVMENEQIEWRSGNSDVDLMRINRAIIQAIRSEAALYAASPLNNDGSLDWAEAAEICKEALDNCRSNDKENILAISQCNVWQYNTAPILSGHVRAGSCPSQELVDCYETIDGKQPILGYTDDSHLTPIINPEATLYDEKNPYANRDPRLQATIYYNGAHAHLLAERPLPTIYTGEGAKHEISSNNTLYTRTGYYLHKYFNITSNRTALMDGYYRVFRLAELYLNYAEAANEAAAGKAPDAAVDAVNAVRDRVGMPKIPYGLSKDEFRKRVRNERRVEFAFEDHRFFDVRRWKILDETTTITGMRPVGETVIKVKMGEDSNYALDEKGNMIEDPEGQEYRTCTGYQRYSVATHKATADKFLRMPVPGKEVEALRRYTGLEFQNPGW